MARRTQEERRTETIGKLVDATIASLDEVGYAATSTSAICRRAGVSQGALFNHFDKRVDLIVATAEAISTRHLQRYAQATAGLEEIDEGKVRTVIEFIRASTRTPDHRAWQEIMTAARTDHELRERVAASLRAFEEALLGAAAAVFGREDQQLGVVTLSLMHMFDSEAVTTAVYPNDAIEAERIEWATSLLRAMLER